MSGHVLFLRFCINSNLNMGGFVLNSYNPMVV